MKGVQQWHALDLVDHPDAEWANVNGISLVKAAACVMGAALDSLLEQDLDSDPVRVEGSVADCRMASG